MYKIIILAIALLTTFTAYAEDCRLSSMTILQKIDDNTYEVSTDSSKRHHLLKTYQTVYKSKGWTQIIISKYYTEKEVLTSNGFKEIWKVYHECSNGDRQQMKLSNQERSRARLKKALKKTSLTDDEIEIWSKVGGRVSNVLGWKRLVSSPEIAFAWINSGFNLYDTKQWMRMDVESAEDAKRWKYCSSSRSIGIYTAKKLIAKGERIPEKCDNYYRH